MNTVTDRRPTRKVTRRTRLDRIARRDLRDQLADLAGHVLINGGVR